MGVDRQICTTWAMADGLGTFLAVLLVRSLGAQNPGPHPSSLEGPWSKWSLCRKSPSHLLNLSSVVLLNSPKVCHLPRVCRHFFLDFQAVGPSAPVLRSTKPTSLCLDIGGIN